MRGRKIRPLALSGDSASMWEHRSRNRLAGIASFMCATKDCLKGIRKREVQVPIDDCRFIPIVEMLSGFYAFGKRLKAGKTMW